MGAFCSNNSRGIHAAGFQALHKERADHIFADFADKADTYPESSEVTRKNCRRAAQGQTHAFGKLYFPVLWYGCEPLQNQICVSSPTTTASICCTFSHGPGYLHGAGLRLSYAAIEMRCRPSA